MTKMARNHLSPKLAEGFWVLGVFVGACVLWELVVKLFHVSEFVLPSIESVVMDAVDAPGFFMDNALYTMAESLVGFVCAAIIGLALSILIVSSKSLDHIVMALLALFNSVPKVALAPLFILWLGTGFTPKVVIAATMSILLIVVDTVAGMRGVDPEMINLARVNRASPGYILFRIRLPHALPHIFGAWKTAISLSVVGAIVGEFVAGQNGLGSVIVVAQGSFDTPRVFAAVFILAIMATVFFYLVAFLESIFVSWHVSHR
jgi:NitT/TauT family transport system permease protein